MAIIDVSIPDLCCDPLDPNVAVVYVSKIGDDANDGLAIDRPKLTVFDGSYVNDAATAALALQSAGAAYVVIHILDAGSYTFDWPGLTNILVYGPAAEMVGQYGVASGSDVRMRQITHPGTGLDECILVRTGESGTARAYFDVIETRGTALDQTSKVAVSNEQPNFILFLECPLINVCRGGIGLQANNTGGIGHIHARITDLYLRDDNAVGIAPVSGEDGRIYGTIDHIVQTKGATGCVGIEADSGLVLFNGNEISCATAYDVSGTADVRIMANRVTGTRTGTVSKLVSGDVTAVGDSMLTIATPAAARWPRVNADGTVTLRTNDETAFEVAGTRFYRATGQSGVSTTWTNIAGLSVPVVSGQYYEIEIRVLAEVDSTNGGVNLALDGPAFSYYAAQFNGVQGSGAFNRVRIIAYDDMDPAGDVTTVNAANQAYFHILRAGIIPSANGTINARIKRGGSAGNITVRGGMMRVYQ